MTGRTEETPTTALLDGRYRLDDCIGTGGMARVYRATDELLGRTVAVKLMRTDVDVAHTARVRTEMELLASVHHPSLVTLYDGCLMPGRPEYLVMELVDGISLAQRLHEETLPAGEVADLAVDLAAGLHVVHAAGIVHRDVKPSNVLLAPSLLPGRTQQAKLADFGIASLTDGARLTSPGLVIGTGAYLAPEQVRGEAPATPVDVYALGLVLLEALTGQRAFPQATGIGEVMVRLLEDPVIPSWIGPQWADLLTAMTAREPGERPTALQVLESAAGLPRDLVAPPLGGTSTDQATMLIPAAGTAPTLAAAALPIPPKPPLPAAVAAASDEVTTETGPTVIPRPALRRTLAAAAVIAALFLGGGALWGTGILVTAETPPAPASVESTDPAEAPSEPVETVTEEEVAVEEAPVQQVSTDVSRVTDRGAGAGTPEKAAPQPGPKKADKAAEKAAKDAEKAAKKAAKDAEKAAKKDAEKAAKDKKPGPAKDKKPGPAKDKKPGPKGGPGDG